MAVITVSLPDLLGFPRPQRNCAAAALMERRDRENTNRGIQLSALAAPV
jgi:hypothetical protein